MICDVNQNNSPKESSSCRCTTALCWVRHGKPAYAIIVVTHARRFSVGHWSFLRPGSESKWIACQAWRRMGPCRTSWRISSRVDIPYSVRPVNWTEDNWKVKKGGKCSIHFRADYVTIESMFSTVVSVNQLRICGAVEDLCEEFVTPLTKTEKVCAVVEQSEFVVESVDLLNIHRKHFRPGSEFQATCCCTERPSGTSFD